MKPKHLPWIDEYSEASRYTRFRILRDITEAAVDEDKGPLPPGVIMRVRGQFAHGDRVTANGNLYKTDLLKREAERLAPELKDGAVVMLSGHPEISEDGRAKSPDVSRATAIIRSLDVLPDGELIGEADIGDTAAGRDVAALIRMGARIGVSTRARGTAQRVKMDDRHPLAKLNPEWVGKEVNVINEDLYLKSADFVLEPASAGSAVQGYREDEEDQVDFDIAKLTEDQWKKILEAAQVKQHVEAQVKAALEEKEKDFEARVQKQVGEQVDQFLQSEDFVKLAVDKLGIELEDAQDKAEAKCPECGGAIAQGMKFCPSCGVKAAPASKKEGAEGEKDAQIEDLKKQIADAAAKIAEQGKTIDKLKNESEQAATAKLVEEKVTEALKAKPALVQKRVRGYLEDRELTEENADEQIKKAVEFCEGALTEAGVKLDKLPAMQYEDENAEQNEGKDQGDGALDETQRAQRAFMERTLRG